MCSQVTSRSSGFDKERQTAIKMLRSRSGQGHILGQSRAIQELRRRISRISPYRVSILISGETGTGKELAARAIHYMSNRSGGPFVPVNCGAIPGNLFENELFGHAQGAFTDARAVQAGLVEEAEKGTLFLDEIGATSNWNQVKLLRLLQNREYKRLGDARLRRADIRIIAATNRDLWSLVKKGRFRQDLYYRLNVVSLKIPPLRDRVEDIPILVEHFLSKYSREYGKRTEGLSSEALQVLTAYSWPGNVRELENRVQQMILMSPTPIIDLHAVQLPRNPSARETSDLGPLSAAKRQVVEHFEKTYLTQLLTQYHGDVVGAARRAGKSRTGLWNLLKKHNLSPKQFRHCHCS